MFVHNNKRFNWKNGKRTLSNCNKWQNQFQNSRFDERNEYKKSRRGKKLSIFRMGHHHDESIPMCIDKNRLGDIFRVYSPWNLYSPIIFTLNDLFPSNWIWKNGSETQIEEKSNERRKKYFRGFLKAFNFKGWIDFDIYGQRKLFFIFINQFLYQILIHQLFFA